MHKPHWIAWVILLAVIGLLAAFWLAARDASPDVREGEVVTPPYTDPS